MMLNFKMSMLYPGLEGKSGKFHCGLLIAIYELVLNWIQWFRVCQFTDCFFYITYIVRNLRLTLPLNQLGRYHFIPAPAGAEAVHGIDFDQASRRASKVAMANAAGNGRKAKGAGCCLGLLQEHWETSHLSESGS